tara:strand:+ start:12085 stop:12381 length:297 start_codon:yes stop_codon:yes gene_type:complete
MKIRGMFFGVATLTLSACTGAQFGNNTSNGGFIKELSEGVLAVADPAQDLTSVKLDPSTGCYIYQRVGPVETMFLPLRTVNGRPICTKLPEAKPKPVT